VNPMLAASVVNAAIAALEVYHEAQAEGALDLVPLDMKRKLRAVMTMESEALQTDITRELDRRKALAADEGDLGELSAGAGL